jgi:hypothetical protein
MLLAVCPPPPYTNSTIRGFLDLLSCCLCTLASPRQTEPSTLRSVPHTASRTRRMAHCRALTAICPPPFCVRRHADSSDATYHPLVAPGLDLCLPCRTPIPCVHKRYDMSPLKAHIVPFMHAGTLVFRTRPTATWTRPRPLPFAHLCAEKARDEPFEGSCHAFCACRQPRQAPVCSFQSSGVRQAATQPTGHLV